MRHAPPSRSPSVRFVWCQLPRQNGQKYLETRKNFLIARLRLCWLLLSHLLSQLMAAPLCHNEFRFGSTRLDAPSRVLFLYIFFPFVSSATRTYFHPLFHKIFICHMRAITFAGLHCVCVWPCACVPICCRFRLMRVLSAKQLDE